MTVENLKQLQALLKLARKEGVESMRIDGIEFHLGYLPDKPKKLPKQETPEVKTPFESLANVPVVPKIDTPDAWDQLTDEQKLMWSAIGEQQ